MATPAIMPVFAGVSSKQIPLTGANPGSQVWQEHSLKYDWQWEVEHCKRREASM